MVNADPLCWYPPLRQHRNCQVTLQMFSRVTSMHIAGMVGNCGERGGTLDMLLPAPSVQHQRQCWKSVELQETRVLCLHKRMASEQRACKEPLAKHHGRGPQKA